jgi:hypothetical protein
LNFNEQMGPVYRKATKTVCCCLARTDGLLLWNFVPSLQIRVARWFIFKPKVQI